MSPIITIFKKEFKDTTRDHRTLLMMIIIPMLLFPVSHTDRDQNPGCPD